MTAGIADLYDTAIKTAAREAVGAGRLENPHHEVTVDNPLCGDRVTMGIETANGEIKKVGHRVRGCLLCEAAASMLGKLAPGHDDESIRDVTAAVEHLMSTGEEDKLEAAWAELAMFAPVHSFKSRHRCVTLPFEALVAALDESKESS